MYLYKFYQYILSHLKYTIRYIPKSYSIVNIFLPTQNVRPDLYLPPVPIFPIRYEAGYVPKAWPVAAILLSNNQDIRRNIYLPLVLISSYTI